VRSLALIALLACGGPAPEPTQLERIDTALSRAGSFLVTRQHDDGAWRSKTYSALRDGWSVTPLVALALRMAPQEPASAGAYRRGVDYLGTIAPGGVVRTAPEVSYPLHAYALGALVLGAPDNKRHRATHGALLQAIRGLQLSKARGWSPSEPSFGGWGYGSEATRRPDAKAGELPTANLSATVLAIGALVLGGTPLQDQALDEARSFVDRCRDRDDGGYFFSPAELGANKAGSDASGPRSYGSMTADGLRSSLRLGRPIDDPDVVGAVGWLDRSFDPANNPGAFPPSDEVRRDSSYFYWVWSAAHAMRHLGRRGWAEALVEELLRRQQVDGSWRNAASEMREDDPLVSTPFAIAALAIARGMISGEPRSHAY
jgi:hypothetical protein